MIKNMLTHLLSLNRKQKENKVKWVHKRIQTLGRMRHSKPLMLKSKFGLSLEYTLTKLFSHWMVVVERGSLFLMSQNTARPLRKEIYISMSIELLILIKSMLKRRKESNTYLAADSAYSGDVFCQQPGRCRSLTFFLT